MSFDPLEVVIADNAFVHGTYLVVVSNGSHMAFAWHHPIDRQLRLVELLVTGAAEVTDDFRREVRRLGGQKDAQFSEASLTPLPTAFIRNLPLGSFLEFARELVESLDHEDELTIEPPDLSTMSAAERRAYQVAEDAFLYVAALLQGRRSPARLIAGYRGISERTAQGRIAKAREMGMLTAAEHGRAGGELTPAARRLLGMPAEGED